MKYYPIAVRLKDKRSIVVGGGLVAERKILSLLDAKAGVTVISPTLKGRLRALVKKGRITWLERVVREKDLQRADIVIAATSDNKVNKNVSKWAKKANVLVNVVDDKVLSDFISPAILRKGKAIIAVYTDGRDPVLSRDLKNFIKGRWNEFLSYRNRP